MDQKQEANVSPESQRLDSILSRMPKGAYKFAKYIDDFDFDSLFDNIDRCRTSPTLTSCQAEILLEKNWFGKVTSILDKHKCEVLKALFTTSLGHMCRKIPLSSVPPDYASFLHILEAQYFVLASYFTKREREYPLPYSNRTIILENENTATCILNARMKERDMENLQNLALKGNVNDESTLIRYGLMDDYLLIDCKPDGHLMKVAGGIFEKNVQVKEYKLLDKRLFKPDQNSSNKNVVPQSQAEHNRLPANETTAQRLPVCRFSKKIKF